MGLFDFYWILLVVSGILMLGLGLSGFGGKTKGVRAVNLIFGAGFIGYGLYLGLFFTGGTYIIFFKAFIVPVLLVVNAVRARSAQPSTPQQPAVWQPAPGQGMAPGAPGQPPATPWAAPGQPPVSPWATPNQGGVPQQPAAPAPLTAPTLSSDDVLGR